MHSVAERSRVETTDAAPPDRPRRGAGARAAELIAPGLLLACIAAEIAVLRVGIDDLDEGYFLQQATRVYRYGQVPYRDFESLYTPGLTYLHAALFWLHGGVWLIGPRLLALGGRAAVVGLMFLLARRLVRNPFRAALPGVVLLVAFDDPPVRWEPQPGWLATAFVLLAVWCVARRRSAGWLLAGGAAAAAAYALKQNSGAAILAALVLRGLWCTGQRPREVVLPLAAFGACTALWLAPLVAALHGDVRPLAGFVGGVDPAALFSPPEPTLLVPLGCLVASLVLMRRQARWLLLAGGCLFLTQFPRMDTLHLAWSTPLLLVLGAAALERLPTAATVAALGLVALLALPTLGTRVESLRTPLVAFDGLEVAPQTARDLQATVGELQQRTAPGEPIFVYPTSPLLYVLADRPNATRFDHLTPNAATPSQIDALVDDLQHADVRVVVVSDFWREAWGAPGPDAVLEHWLARRFVTIVDHDSYRLLSRL